MSLNKPCLTLQELTTNIFIERFTLCLLDVLWEHSVGIWFHLEYLISYPLCFLAFPHVTDKEQICLCRNPTFMYGIEWL